MPLARFLLHRRTKELTTMLTITVPTILFPHPTFNVLSAGDTQRKVAANTARSFQFLRVDIHVVVEGTPAPFDPRPPRKRYIGDTGCTRGFSGTDHFAVVGLRV